ncbi:hypothetical protein EDEG_02403 [Edhazardia aedis USNM 41457]|uniref:DNA mismatch repair proteins mutS family domain-containing protein n=1 Tax=Edhazardia aedis (strain USNM 41457) TaxID=1003232 RepID=J9DKW7_EDHAE|nr:hypothetical protein EDEG_02403 [Edhazardia aedis USNM 41457]|eukprot:EJW03235.1 hypothetical protein EDEG_02403 [Edhazardia aedis USNM 41457]
MNIENKINDSIQKPLIVISISRNISPLLALAVYYENLKTLTCLEFNDSLNFTLLSQQILLYDPFKIVIPAGKNLHLDNLQKIFADIEIVEVSRSCYSINKLQIELLPDILKEKYFLQSSIAALNSYLGVDIFDLKIELKHLNNRMFMSLQTITDLEIIKPTDGDNLSLFNAINNTKTKMGERLLRENIIQPFTDISTIQNRHNVVEFFISNGEIALNLEKILESFLDIDKIVVQMNDFTKKKYDHEWSYQKHFEIVFLCLQIKTILAEIVNLKKMQLTDEIFKDLLELLTDKKIDDISKVFNEFTLENQIFLNGDDMLLDSIINFVKSDKNRYLKIARQILLENMRDIKEYHTKYIDYIHHEVELKFTFKYGFVFKTKNTNINEQNDLEILTKNDLELEKTCNSSFICEDKKSVLHFMLRKKTDMAFNNFESKEVFESDLEDSKTSNHVKIVNNCNYNDMKNSFIGSSTICNNENLSDNSDWNNTKNQSEMILESKNHCQTNLNIKNTEESTNSDINTDDNFLSNNHSFSKESKKKHTDSFNLEKDDYLENLNSVSYISNNSNDMNRNLKNYGDIYDYEKSHISESSKHSYEIYESKNKACNSERKKLLHKNFFLNDHINVGSEYSSSYNQYLCNKKHKTDEEKNKTYKKKINAEKIDDINTFVISNSSKSTQNTGNSKLEIDNADISSSDRLYTIAKKSSLHNNNKNNILSRLPHTNKFIDKKNSNENFENTTRKIYIIEKSGETTVYTTLELERINCRIKDAIEQVIQLESKYCYNMIQKIAQHNPFLLKISSFLAEIDVSLSFYIFSTNESCTLPEFSDSIVINETFNLLTCRRKRILNNVYASNLLSFNVVTGANMCGKTTYIKSIGHSIILAQIGCPLNARYAKLKIFKKLLTRLNNDDQINENLSTFGYELKELRNILENSDNESMVLIDELGRGTNYQDGLALAINASRHLLKRRSFVYFVTHFTEIITFLQESSSLNVLKCENFRTSSGISNEYSGIQFCEKYFSQKIIQQAKYIKNLISKNNYLKSFDNSKIQLAAKILECKTKDEKEQLLKIINSNAISKNND